MVWWILAIVLLVAGIWIAIREKDVFLLQLGLIISLLFLVIGLGVSLIITTGINNPEGMTITETNEIKLYSIELYESKHKVLMLLCTVPGLLLMLLTIKRGNI